MEGFNELAQKATQTADWCKAGLGTSKKGIPPKVGGCLLASLGGPSERKSPSLSASAKGLAREIRPAELLRPRAALTDLHVVVSIGFQTGRGA